MARDLTYEELEQRVKELEKDTIERRQVEEKYRFLVENANDAIFITQDGVVKFPNSRTVEAVGYSAEELEKIPFVDLIHPEDRDMVLERYMKRLRGEEVPNTYSFRIIVRGGGELWVELNAVSINWEGKPAALNFLRDTTQQKKLESQLLQAQKMEAVGTLAGGIAHDFNNLLMGIQGNASLALLDTGTSNLHYERLKNIEEYVQKGADLTKQLLGFARGGKYEVKAIDLNKVVKESSVMFGRTKKEITIHTKFQKELWVAEGDQGQIEQVLLNLYVNACHAMPGGGDLYLSTENVILGGNYAGPYGAKAGEYIKISVQDTGIGMDKATQQKIFDPFFTTKKMGRGTGLGLASSSGIIKNHGGIIEVHSEKLKGSTFNIYLPASIKEVKKEENIAKELLMGSESILLVDDEEMIIEVGKQMLEKLGYKILTARGAKETIKLYHGNKDEIDIVILDMIMPDYSGIKTYGMLKEINPDIKVLLSSGYSVDGQATDILSRGCNGFIQKPFNMKELSQKTREILDKG